MAQRRRCTQCTSRRFHTNDEGFYVCHRGHQVELIVEEVQDEEITPSNRATRTINRRKHRSSGDDSMPDEVLSESQLVFKVRLLQFAMEKITRALVKLFPSVNKERIQQSMGFVLCCFIDDVEEREVGFGFKVCITLTVVGLNFAGIGICIQDVIKLIVSGEIPYLSIYDDVPEGWKDRVKCRGIELAVENCPDSCDFTHSVVGLLKKVGKKNNGLLPPFPVYSFLYSLLKRMNLSLSMVDKIDRLRKVILVDVEFKRVEDMSVSSYPAVVLGGLLFILIQMCYDIDSVEFQRWLNWLELEVKKDFEGLNYDGLNFKEENDFERYFLKVKQFKYFNTPDNEIVSETRALLGDLLLEPNSERNESPHEFKTKPLQPNLLNEPAKYIQVFGNSFCLQRYEFDIPKKARTPNVQNFEGEIHPSLLSLLVIMAQLIGVTPIKFYNVLSKLQNEFIFSMAHVFEIIEKATEK